MLKFNKKCGFTLAEVLVTLGLIGVVSALTIPTLAFNYKAKVLEEQFRSTYSDIRQTASMLNFQHSDVGQYARRTSLDTWEKDFVSFMNSGNTYTDTAPGEASIVETIRDYYKAGGGSLGPYYFGLGESGQRESVEGFVCGDGKLWTDSKGRLWSFKDDNRLICVDINGAGNPNRYNIDIFAFAPMNSGMMAAWVYNDANNPSNYTGTIVPCDIERLHKDFELGKTAPTLQDGSVNKYDTSVPSALDACPYFEPLENTSPVNDDGVGTSARGRTVTRQNNYWKDYINFR